MDVLMLSSIKYSMNELLSKKVQITSKLFDLLTTDVSFRNSIKIGTSDTKVITYRLSRWSSEVENIVTID